jgi:hypothetical protein
MDSAMVNVGSLLLTENGMENLCIKLLSDDWTICMGNAFQYTSPVALTLRFSIKSAICNQG